jgi:excisionase family DNA binding protein
MSGINLNLDPQVLEPLITRAVDQALIRNEEIRTSLGDKLCFSEAEAAAKLGLKQHQLRDARRAGKIGFSRITGNRIRYKAEDLLDYLSKNRTEAVW